MVMPTISKICLGFEGVYQLPSGIHESFTNKSSSVSLSSHYSVQSRMAAPHCPNLSNVSCIRCICYGTLHGTILVLICMHCWILSSELANIVWLFKPLWKCGYSHYQHQWDHPRTLTPYCHAICIPMIWLPTLITQMLESKHYSTMVCTIIFIPPPKLPTIKLQQMLYPAWSVAIILAQQPYLCGSCFTKANVWLLPAHIATIPWCLHTLFCAGRGYMWICDLSHVLDYYKHCLQKYAPVCSFHWFGWCLCLKLSTVIPLYPRGIFPSSLVTAQQLGFGRFADPEKRKKCVHCWTGFMSIELRNVSSWKIINLVYKSTEYLRECTWQIL